MPISTYFELKEAIRSFGKRSDVLSLLDTFIDQTESEMYANPDEILKIRVEERENITIGTSSSVDNFWADGFWADGFWADGFWGDAVDPSRYIDLPDRFLEMRRIRIETNCGEYFLTSKTPETLPISTISGRPSYYSVVNESIELDRIPDQEYDMELLYFATVAPLSATSPTNTVLTRFPNIYLNGGLHFLHKWARNEPLADYYYAEFIKAIRGANKRDRRARYSATPTIQYAGTTP